MSISWTSVPEGEYSEVNSALWWPELYLGMPRGSGMLTVQRLGVCVDYIYMYMSVSAYMLSMLENHLRLAAHKEAGRLAGEEPSAQVRRTRVDLPG